MNRIQPFPVVLALSFIFSFLYLFVMGIHVFLPGDHWPMLKGLNLIVFALNKFMPFDLLIRLLEIFLLSFYIAYTLVPLYNFFAKKSSLKIEDSEKTTFRFKPIAAALIGFGLITYSLCIIFDLIFPQWTMYKLWEILLPGFKWLSWSSFFIGALLIIVYGLVAAVVFVSIYNYLQKGGYSEMNSRGENRL